MIDLPLGGSSAPPGLRRPRFSITFGAGGGGGGALGGLGAAVAGAVGLGGGSDDPWKRSLVSLTIEAALAPIVDVLEMILVDDAQAPPVAVGDAGTVSIGYEDAEDKVVFTGTVDRIVRGLDGRRRITARNGGGELARLRLNQSYEQQSAADVVSELAGRASLQSEVAAGGETLPFVALDDRATAYDHIARLARRQGNIAFIDPEGRLRFVEPPSGDPVHTYNFGIDLLSLQVADAAPELGLVTAYGEGAAGSQGQDAWAWVVKDAAPVTGTAGSGSPERSFPDGVVRTGAGATAAAQALSDRAAARRVTVRARVPGSPEVAVGSVVEIAGAAAESANGRFLVRRLRHRLDIRAGFVTDLWLHTAGAGGGGGLPGFP